jgi:hypothetical protein
VSLPAAFTSGRMSRADAQRTLSEIRATLPEFSTPDASPQTLSEVADISATHGILQDSLDRGSAPNAYGIRALRTRVAALQWDRLQNSLRTEHRVTPAAVVTLYGPESADDIDTAARHAAVQMQVPLSEVRLQDRSHVRSATLTGTRYIFTSQTP